MNDRIQTIQEAVEQLLDVVDYFFSDDPSAGQTALCIAAADAWVISRDLGQTITEPEDFVDTFGTNLLNTIRAQD